MPHEFKNLSRLSHEALGYILAGGLTSVVVIIGLVIALSRKDRRNSGGDRPAPHQKRSNDKRRRRR
jgi:hypothetical protein